MNLESLARTCYINGGDNEYGILYDTKTKQIVWEKKGKKDSLFIPKKFMGKQDCIFIHNHPLEYNGSIMFNSPLSPNDVYTTMGYNHKGIVATDGMNLYVIMRPKNGWGILKKVSQFDKEFFRLFKSIQNDMKRDVKNLKLSPDKYYTTATIKQYKKVFKDVMGLNMEVIPMKNPCYFSKINYWFIAPKDIPSWMKSSPKLMELLKKKWEYAQKKLNLKKTMRGLNTQLESRVQQLEETIRNTKGIERALYIDENGNVIYDSNKGGAHGSKTTLIVEDDEKLAPKTAVAIHSHPVSMYGGYYWGSSFSSDDIANAIRHNFPEIRFCDKYYTGILRRIGDRWVNKWGNDIKKNIGIELDENKEKYKKKMVNGEIKVSDYLVNYNHYAVRDFAKKYGLDYERVLRHELPAKPDFNKTLAKQINAHPKMWVD